MRNKTIVITGGEGFIGSALALRLSAKNIVISIDNHYCEGGQGMRIAEALSKFNSDTIEFKHLGVDGIPKCGTTEEVMTAHDFTEEALYKLIKHKLPLVNQE